MSFEDWVQQRYARPVVVVESSAAADAVCARNGLDLIHLLRPHSVYVGGPLYSRTGDRSDPVVCPRFGVRLMRTDCVRDAALSQVARHTRRLLRNAAPIDLAYGEQLDRALTDVIEKGRSSRDGSLARPLRPAMSSPSAAAAASSPSTGTIAMLLERACPTWHRSFVREFHSLVRCSSFDTLDYPIGALCAVATTESGGVEGIMQIFRAQARRIQELRTSLPGMDTELHQYYLIIHDNTSPQSPSLSTARQVLTAVQQLYGTNYCALVKVNSVVDPRAVKSLDPSLWIDASPAVMDVPSAQAVQRAAAESAGAARASASTSDVAAGAAAAVAGGGNGARTAATLSFRAVHSTCGTWPNSNAAILTGCYMSPEDVAEVHNVMAYYLSQSLFKFVERRLRMLDVSVQDRRTTTLGKMAAWFKGKDEGRPRAAEVVYPASGTDSSVMPKYMAHSLEMQMRHCGDLSLVLHDVEGAVGYYRMCVEELIDALPQRPFNRALIAACQEGIGVAQLLQRRLAPQSLTPWYTGATSATQRLSSQTNRWEVAWNDYLAAGTQTYAVRIAFLLYEYSRTRTPPLLDRCRAILTHLQRSGILQRQNLLNGVVSDMLAGIAVFHNPPYPAGLSVPPSIPRDYPVYLSLRRFAQRLQQAGALFRAENSLEQALRCYLRVLELFRVVDPQETWKGLVEHLYLTAGQLYSQLGQDVRGIALTSAAVTQGTPLYRDPATARQAFEAFWTLQKNVLTGMGYALCPHMPMPRIVRDSFHVDRNYYGTDTATDEAARRMSEAAAETEWHGMERHLRKRYTDTVLAAHPRYRFPAFHGTGKESGGAGGAGSGAVAASSSPSPPLRHYTIARAEPLVLSFVMENTVGCPVEATELTLLYLAYASPEQLWKSSTTQTVRLEPGARQQVSLSFDPVAEGEYAIIGLCWSLMEQEGYYYFATRESRPGCLESVYEYAIEHPMPTLEAPENIHVTVTPSKACVTATLHPELPEHLYDGEYFHTALVVHNTSAHQDAAHVVLQRSAAASHLLYFDDFGHERNLVADSPLVLAEHLKAQETRRFAVTVRAQHRRGDTATQSSPNYVFLLLGYLPGTADPTSEMPAPLPLPLPSVTSAPDVDSGTAPSSAPESALASVSASPTMTPHGVFHSPTSAGVPRTLHGHAAAVRLHRLLRRCEVQPVVAMHSTVLPPSNASMRTAVVLTVKNICPAVSRVAASAGSGGVARSLAGETAEVVQAVSVSGSKVGVGSPTYAPVRVARVLVVHSPRWAVQCDGTEELFADRAMQCLLGHGDSLTLPLLVKRRPRAADGGVDTTVRHVFLRDGTASAAASPYRDTTCVPLASALPSPTRCAAVEAQIGVAVAKSGRDLFFLQTSGLGPGRVGARPTTEDGSGGGLAFYADKAGQQKEAPKTAEQRRRAEVEEERRLCGGPSEQYTPLAVAVTWVREKGGGAGSGMRHGQVFLFVDPIEHVYQTLAQQQQRQAEQEAAVAASPRAAGAGTGVSVEQFQQELCEAMLVRYGSLKPWQGAVVAHVHVPPTVTAPSSGGGSGSGGDAVAATVPVTLRCLSLAPVPVLVTAEALPPHANVSLPSYRGPTALERQSSDGGVSSPRSSAATPLRLPSPDAVAAAAASRASDVPVLFVGKTVHTFLLMPSDEHELHFTALALRPGLVDCQRIAITAAPICYLHGGPGSDATAAVAEGAGEERGPALGSSAAPLMFTGMTMPSLTRALTRSAATSTSASATTRVLRSARRLLERDRLVDDDGGVGELDCPVRRGLAVSGGVGGGAVALLDRTGLQAAEMVRLLAPLGPAGGASAAQVMPHTTPALTHVVVAASEKSAAAAQLPGTRAALPLRGAEPARKFFRQLENFEAELQRTSAANPSDPHALQYVYRPAVKAASGAGGGGGGVGTASTTRYRTENTSFAMSTSATAAAQSWSIGAPMAAPPSPGLPPTPPLLPSTAAAAARMEEESVPCLPSVTPPAGSPTPLVVAHGSGGTAGVGSGSRTSLPSSVTSRRRDTVSRPLLVADLAAVHGSVSSATASPGQLPCDEGVDEDDSDGGGPASPLHLPAVAFQGRTAAALVDICELNTPLSAGAPLVEDGPQRGHGTADTERDDDGDEEAAVVTDTVEYVAAPADSDSLCVTSTNTQSGGVSPLHRLRSDDIVFSTAAAEARAGATGQSSGVGGAEQSAFNER